MIRSLDESRNISLLGILIILPLLNSSYTVGPIVGLILGPRVGPTA